MTLLRSPLLRFIAIRLLYTVAVLLGVMVAVFFLIQIVPGDPVRIAQSYIIGGNELFWASGLLFFALVIIVWFARRPSPAASAAGGGH